jgi:hypothetical protein
MALWVKLSCGFPADSRVAEAGVHAELLYIRALLHCRETLTDGLVSRHSLQRVALGIPKPERQADALVAVGLWLLDDRGWRIPEDVWRKWNPTASEVDDERTAAAERKAAWRARRKSPNGTTAHATEMSQRDNTVAYGTRDLQPEPEPEPEKEKPPSQVLTSGASPPGRVDEALTILAKAELARAPAGSVKAPAAWTRTVVESNRHTFGATLHRLAHEHPDWTGQQLADALAKPTQPSVVERPLCQQCHRHTTGLVECPPASPTCPTSFMVEVVS